VRLPWPQLVSGESAENLVFSLKYFEEFAGEITLPAGFDPVRVLVTLIPDGNGTPRVEESFDWARLLGNGGT
jgi:hypothetical protein